MIENMDDLNRSDLDAAKRARQLARRERKARRKQERAAMAARTSPVAENTAAEERMVVNAPSSVPSQLPAEKSGSGDFASAVGPLGGRVARIASNMLIKQAIKFVMGALLRR